MKPSTHQDQGGRVGPGVLSLEHVCDQELGLDTKKSNVQKAFRNLFSSVTTCVQESSCTWNAPVQMVMCETLTDGL